MSTGHRRDVSTGASPEVESLRYAGLKSLDRNLVDRQRSLASSDSDLVLVSGWLAGLEWRALQAEVGWGRMRSRRLYRMVNVLVAMVRRPLKSFGGEEDADPWCGNGGDGEVGEDLFEPVSASVVSEDVPTGGYGDAFSCGWMLKSFEVAADFGGGGGG